MLLRLRPLKDDSEAHFVNMNSEYATSETNEWIESMKKKEKEIFAQELKLKKEIADLQKEAASLAIERKKIQKALNALLPGEDWPDSDEPERKKKKSKKYQNEMNEQNRQNRQNHQNRQNRQKGRHEWKDFKEWKEWKQWKKNNN